MSDKSNSENIGALEKATKFLDTLEMDDPAKKVILAELTKKTNKDIQAWLDTQKVGQAEAEAKDTAIRKEFVDRVESEKHFTPGQKNSLLQKLSNLKVGDTDGFTELIKQYSNYMEEYEKEEEEGKQSTEKDPSDSQSPKKKGLSFAGKPVMEKGADRVRKCYSDSKTAKKLKAEKEGKKTSKSK